MVDNDQQITNFLAADLLPILGYQTLVAHDGRTALELVRTRQPDLMLLDLQLTDTNGLAVLRQLASEGFTIPTIIVTGHGSERVAVDALRLGVQDYLLKPLEIKLLTTAISRALSETRLHREKTQLVSQLKQQVNWLTVLSKVGQSVTSTLELEQVLRRIVDAAVYLTRAEEGFLALLDEQNDQLHLRAAKDIDHARSTLLNLRLNDSTAGRAILTRRPVRLNTTMHGQSLKVSTGYLVNSLLQVPIFSKDTALGILSVDNRTGQRLFTEMDEILLAALADYAAVAIDNARLYERAQREIDERKRAEAQLEASLQEKEILLQEIHHRVKNNLQIISSLLNLQADYIKDQAVVEILRDSRNRIRSMALIHEKLYRSGNLAQIDFSQYIKELATFVLRSQNGNTGKLTLNIQAAPVLLGINIAVPCGLILNELISNALKHAFPDGRSGEIRVQFQVNQGGQLILIVADNGIGFPQELDFRATESLGMQLVNTLVDQLGGTIELQDQSGAAFKIMFAMPNESAD